MWRETAVCLSLFMISFLSCSKPPRKITRISVHVYAAPTEKIYLSRIPYIDEKTLLIDSAIIKEEADSIIFNVPAEDDRMYELTIRSSHQKFFFVADAPYILFHANNITGKFTALGTAATNSLKKFYETRTTRYNLMREIKKKMDSAYQLRPVNKKLTDSLSGVFQTSLNETRQFFRNYADSVSNPAVFLACYDNIDFGEDRASLKKMITNAQQRFPDSKVVNNLVRDVFDMISIYEQEFNVGDTLPTISLPNPDGNLVSTKSFRGRYYLIDFWATWCPRCLYYNSYKADLFSKTNPVSFQLVSVALDDNRDDWKAFIAHNHYDWNQLLDEKMWRGTAARTLKFDSIPFNFLVSPNGIVLAKAIRPDSLLTTVRQFVR
jgi:thiol-disulfide isomerase/thioredoxin